MCLLLDLLSCGSRPLVLIAPGAEAGRKKLLGKPKLALPVWHLDVRAEGKWDGYLPDMRMRIMTPLNQYL